MLGKLSKNRPTRYFFDFIVFTTAVVLPFSVHAGVFQTIIANSVSAQESLSEVVSSDSIIDARVLASALNPNPNIIEEGNEVLIQDGTLVSSGPINSDKINVNPNSDAISVYTVREGDSLSEIAEMFGVTSNTILWANDISKATSIKPGDNLIILPIAGTRHVVKQGDSIATIAKKYNGNAAEIVSYNQLDSATDIKVGDTLVIPGGEVRIEKPKVIAASNSTVTKTKTSTPTNTFDGFVNPIPGAIRTQGIHGRNSVDFGVSIGTPVRAAAAGQVIIAKNNSGWNGGYGNYIVIQHADGVQTLYAHLSRADVSVGETVASAENIGASGNTGKSTGPHLHFEVRGAKNPF